MSRVLAGTNVYRRQHPRSLRRAELVEALVRHSPGLLPGLILLPCGLVKDHHGDEAAADLLIVDDMGDRWWVATVHSSVVDFEDEVVLPSLILSRSQYLMDDIAEVTAGQSDDVAVPVNRVMALTPPSAVAFVPSPRPEWFLRLAEIDAGLAVIETFASTTGPDLFRLNGSLPVATGTLMWNCARLPANPHILELRDAASSWPKSGAVIEWEGEALPYTQKPAGQDVVLKLPKSLELSEHDALNLWQLGTDHYSLRLATM